MPYVTAPVVVILAAGQGTRMRSATPKLLHPLCGRPLLSWTVDAARAAGAAKVVVVGGPDRALAPGLPDDVVLAVQQEARGTADAVQAAAAEIDRDAPVIVLNGDVPLMTGASLHALAAAHERAGRGGDDADDGAAGPDRLRPRRARRPTAPSSASSRRRSRATRPRPSWRSARSTAASTPSPAATCSTRSREVRSDNAQGELYLPDVLPILRGRGGVVRAHVVDDPGLALGVNDRGDLAKVRAEAQRRILAAHMAAGVTIVDPGSTVVDAGVEIGADTTILPFSSLLGGTRVGSGSTVGPQTTLIDAALGDGVAVPHSYLTGCTVDDGASVGPFAYLRPGARLRAGAKVGTFVEVKNSDIGEGTKVPHLSYIGDADVGPGSNLGAGTITANYDGSRKHRTTIGARVKGGVDTAFVAPVTRRRRRLDGGGVGHHRGRAGGRPRRRPVTAAERRAVQRAQQGERGLMSPLITTPGASSAGRRLVSQMSAGPQEHPNSHLEIGYGKQLMLFSGRAHQQLGADIAGKLGVELGGVHLRTFTNGEVYCRYEESIRGADVFIVQPICGNELTGITPNDSLMELLEMVDAAVGGSAHRVVAVCPWYGYSRQDKKSAPREPISARLVARMLETAGIDRILTMDLHAGQIQGFFHKPCDHMTAMWMLTQILRRPVARGPRRRLAGRRPREAEQEVRRHDRRRAGDPQQGAPGPAGRRDRLRDR